MSDRDIFWAALAAFCVLSALLSYLRGFLGEAWKDPKPWLQRRFGKRP